MDTTLQLRGHRAIPEDKRKVMSGSFIDVLADLHAVDPDEVGLEISKKKITTLDDSLKPGIDLGWRRLNQLTSMIPEHTNSGVFP